MARVVRAPGHISLLVHGTGVHVTIVGDQVIRGLATEASPWEKVDVALKPGAYVFPTVGAHDD